MPNILSLFLNVNIGGQMDTLKDYQRTGFSVAQINKMYESLLIVQDLITRLICGDFLSINKAVDDAIWFLDGVASFNKENLN